MIDYAITSKIGRDLDLITSFSDREITQIAFYRFEQNFGLLISDLCTN
jgi:hypothetical protein